MTIECLFCSEFLFTHPSIRRYCVNYIWNAEINPTVMLFLPVLLDHKSWNNQILYPDHQCNLGSDDGQGEYVDTNFRINGPSVLR